MKKTRKSPPPTMRRTSSAYRRERWRRCTDYLHRAGSLPAAVKLAKAEGFGAPTSAWITALGKMLDRQAGRQP